MAQSKSQMWAVESISVALWVVTFPKSGVPSSHDMLGILRECYLNREEGSATGAVNPRLQSTKPSAAWQYTEKQAREAQNNSRIPYIPLSSSSLTFQPLNFKTLVDATSEPLSP